MVYVTNQHGDTFEWHIGEKSLIYRSDFNPLEVIEVQADGDELDFIYTMTRGVSPTQNDSLPFAANANVVRWFGDHAKFIAYNILQ